MQEQTQAFKIGDIVWAKITGYPWWPGQVCNRTIQSKAEFQDKYKYFIIFFGDNSHAYLPALKLAAFQSKYQQFAGKCNTKKFQQSLYFVNHYIATRQGSLLDQEIFIDSHPICLSFDKSTSFACEDKLTRIKDIDDIPETIVPIEPVHFQQKILLQQFCKEDLSNINQSNIIQLLEYGLVSQIRQAGYQQQFVQAVEQTLKEKLLEKYSLQQIKQQKLAIIKEKKEVKPTVLKTKKIFKKKRSDIQRALLTNDLPIKRLCVLRLYEFLKCSTQLREKSMAASTQVIDHLIEHFGINSDLFKTSYKRLLQWLNTHKHREGTNSDYLYQKMDDFINLLCNNQNHLDQKSKQSQHTSCSQTK